MRVVISAVFLLLPPFSLLAQEKEQWRRIYTFEESTVDLDVSNVTFGSDFTGRVRFQLSFSKTQSVPGRTGHKYKRVIETLEFRCDDSLYRLFRLERFDSKGKSVEDKSAEPMVEWRPVEKGGMIDKFLTPGCQLIYEKKRNP